MTWPFVGRSIECDTVADILDGTGASSGVVIAGAAGVGKSRLAMHAAADAQKRGRAIRRVMGSETLQAIPLGAFEQWASGPGSDALGLVRTTIANITTTPNDEPVLIVVDDAHLLDNISAFTLHQIVLRGAAQVIATVRTGETEPDAIASLWKDGHLSRLDLHPLSRAESVSLLEAALAGPVDTAVAERLWSRTRGNILYLRQLVDHELRAEHLRAVDGRWQWPEHGDLAPSLVTAIERQMGALSGPLQRVVDIASVADPIELAMLRELADPGAIEEAEGRGLIVVDDALVRLGHPLYGEARRATLGSGSLQHIRSEIVSAARTLALTGNPAADPIWLAGLLLDSDLPADRDALTVAAWSAILRLDLKLTERFADAAIRAGAGIDVQLLRAQTLILLNRGDAAEGLLDSIDTGELPDPLRATFYQLRATNLLWILDAPERSWQLVDQALATEGGVVADSLWALRAVQSAYAAQPDDAAAIVEKLELSQLPPFPAMMGSWAATIVGGDQGRSEDAVRRAAEGYARAAIAPEIVYQTIHLSYFEVIALVLSGHLDAAQQVADNMMSRHSDMPDITRSVTTAIAGAVATHRGDLALAGRQLGSAIADFSVAEFADGASYNDNGLSYAFLIVHPQALAKGGMTAEADAALELMRRCRPLSHRYLESERLLAEAWVAAAHDDMARAGEFVARATQFAHDNRQHARELYCLQTALQFGSSGPEPNHRIQQIVELVDGPRASAVANWAAALDTGSGHALLAVSAELAVLGDQVSAADAAAQASVLFAERGLTVDALVAAATAAALARETGANTPALRRGAEPVRFTKRERQLARLMADGMTNKEMAGALTVSLRTVEGHVYRMCHKLGVTDRSELVRVAEYLSS